MENPRGFKGRKAPSRRDLLNDIIDYGESARKALYGISREAFLDDDVRHDAVCYKIQCVSEATVQLLHLDPEIAEEFPNLPWHKIRAIGNVLRHVYHDIDLHIIWDAVSGEDLPQFIAFAREALTRIA